MKKKITLILIILLFLSNNLFSEEKRTIQKEKPRAGMGLSVQPGGILIQHVKLDETYNFYEKSGIALIVENKDTLPHTYIINTFKPSQVGNKKWLTGYLEIPEPSWFFFEKNEVTVEPKSKQKVKMYLKVPKEEKYYNQHWTVSLGVTGKPEKGQMLALAVYPRYQIETETKTGLKEKPAGLIGFEPGTLIFENLALGKKEKNKIIVYNNDNKPHKYRITPKIIEVDTTKEQIFNTPGYRWIPNIKWIRPCKRKLKINSDESKEITITVNIPKKQKYYLKKWEAIIFIEPDEGPSGFVRVQIEPNK